MNAKTIWRLPTVMSRTGLGRSSIYDKISKGEFPEPIHLGRRAIGFIAEEIQDWIQARIDDSRADDES